MYTDKPRFKLNKQQRNGVFAFVVVILFVQWVYMYKTSCYTETNETSSAVIALHKKIDSLKRLKRLKAKSKSYNPNYLTDEQGYLLGMSIKEIDRLFAYRKKNKWCNNAKEFQEVTQISDSLFSVIGPLLRFPGKPGRNRLKEQKRSEKKLLDINKASQRELEQIRGVGSVLSERIVKYRAMLGGFSTMGQLVEVWGLSDSTVKNIEKQYKVFTPPEIDKLNINTATFKEALSIVYLDYKSTKLLFKYRDSVGKIKDLEEIKKIPEFPIDKYDRIALYLRAK